MKIENAYKSFYKNNQEIIILNNVTMDFKKGKFYLIIGESGAGKSTLINILGLLDTLDKGIISIDGEEITNLKDDNLSNIRLHKIGLIFQDYYLNPRLTAKDNVLIATLINKEIVKIEERVDKILSSFNLSSRASHYPEELSGGEAQRVCIARALVNNPTYILADEPTGSLDPDNAKVVMQELIKLKEQNKCIIMVTHDYRNIKYADYVYKLKDGDLIKEDKNAIYKEYIKKEKF